LAAEHPAGNATRLSPLPTGATFTTPQPARPAAADDRLTTREYVGYALGDTASNLFFQTFNIFLIYYYVDVWAIPAAAIATMMLLTRVWDAATDPIMGLIADRTETRWGKFRPYILFGAIPFGACGYLLFAGPDLSPTGKLVYAYITYSLMLMSYTVVNVPYSSLLGVISPSSGTRAVASSFRFMGAFTGALLISLLVRPLVRYLGDGNEVQGFQMTMAIFAVLAVVMFWIAFASTRERVKPPAQQKSDVRGELRDLLRNWPWMVLLITAIISTTFIALRSGSTLFYFKYVVGDDGSPLFLGLDQSTIFLTTGALGMILGTASLAPIARRIDKKYYAAALSFVTGLCFLAFYLIPRDAYGAMLAVNALAWYCAGPTTALTWALYADVADYGEWKFGRRTTGLVYSASLFAIKTGVVAGGFLLPFFLDRFGFVRDVEQTALALLGITLAFSVVPGVLGLLKGVALLIYPLDQRRVDEIEKALAERRTHAEPEAQPA
jgi:glycoside/pentoside/hexuronide:cation symporter, GPH family